MTLTTSKIIVAPSILSSDFARLADESEKMKQFGADWLHVDVMDGHFVPNLTIGAPIVKSLRRATDMYLDCHLMVTNPAQWIESFAKAGANGITFHFEAFTPSTIYDKDDPNDFACDMTKDEKVEIINTCKKIRQLGMRCGLAIRPRTQLSSAKFLLDEQLIDLLLVMTVEPGFGGQKFMPSVMHKVTEARQKYPYLHIQVDGGISPSTVDTVVNAGANVLVAGSAIFGAEDPKAVIECLHNGGTEK